MSLSDYWEYVESDVNSVLGDGAVHSVEKKCRGFYIAKVEVESVSDSHLSQIRELGYDRVERGTDSPAWIKLELSPSSEKRTKWSMAVE